ncbi:hypothetical protein [Candidatus Rariloculus sp.]|uniref:hypothetical protein n=1 Tax=Candidatus Rariloculus sp. TaxID=3101265 RepID=UPI003D11C8BB
MTGTDDQQIVARLRPRRGHGLVAPRMMTIQVAAAHLKSIDASIPVACHVHAAA